MDVFKQHLLESSSPRQEKILLEGMVCLCRSQVVPFKVESARTELEWFPRGVTQELHFTPAWRGRIRIRSFCIQQEPVKHLLFICHYVSYMDGIKNAGSFLKLQGLVV